MISNRKPQRDPYFHKLNGYLSTVRGFYVVQKQQEVADAMIQAFQSLLSSGYSANNFSRVVERAGLPAVLLTTHRGGFRYGSKQSPRYLEDKYFSPRQ